MSITTRHHLLTQLIRTNFHRYRRVIFSLLFAMTLLITCISMALRPVQAGGIPTIDAAAIAQMVKQFIHMEKEYKQMLEEFAELQQQTEELTNIKDRLEGITGMADMLRQEHVLELFPELTGVEDFVDYGLGDMPAGALKIYKQRGFFEACSATKGDNRKLCESSGAYLATAEYAFNSAMKNTQKRITNIESMIDQIDKSTTAKETADLQARIQAEIGLVQVSQMKTQLMRDRMDSAMQNLRAQEKIKMHKFLFG